MTGRHLRASLSTRLANNRDDIVAPRSREPARCPPSRLARGIGGDGGTFTVDSSSMCRPTTRSSSASTNFNKQVQPHGARHPRTAAAQDGQLHERALLCRAHQPDLRRVRKDQFTPCRERRRHLTASNFTQWGQPLRMVSTRTGWGSKHNKCSFQVPRVLQGVRGQQHYLVWGSYIEKHLQALWDVSMEPHRYRASTTSSRHSERLSTVSTTKRPSTCPSRPCRPLAVDGRRETAYNYYMYHLWANIRTLKRSSRIEPRALDTSRSGPTAASPGRRRHLTACVPRPRTPSTTASI